MSNRNESGSAAAWLIIIVGGGLIAASALALLMWIGPNYNVWSQSKAGEAKLRESESSRQVLIQEAKARKEAAVYQAEAEIERARGVAQANQIIGKSLQGNPEYLQYLYITGLQDKPGENNDRTVIYVPTEKGLPLPALEATRLNSEAKK